MIWLLHQRIRYCNNLVTVLVHYDDVIMGAMASQITSLTIVYSTAYSDADQRKHQKLRVPGLCAGNSPGTGEFPTQMASNAENVSISWRHHVNTAIFICIVPCLCMSFIQFTHTYPWFSVHFVKTGRFSDQIKLRENFNTFTVNTQWGPVTLHAVLGGSCHR